MHNAMTLQYRFDKLNVTGHGFSTICTSCTYMYMYALTVSVIMMYVQCHDIVQYNVM